jgi:hypothetical protein
MSIWSLLNWFVERPLWLLVACWIEGFVVGGLLVWWWLS